MNEKLDYSGTFAKTQCLCISAFAMKRLDQKFHPCNLLGDIEDYTHVIRKQSTIYSGVSYGQSLNIGISAHFHIF